MSQLDKLIIAHRGESFDAPENTLAAVNLAWERKAKAVEIDIHFTKDQEIVAIHDEDTFRISGKKHKVKESTLQELKKLDFGSFKNSRWHNERIPTLAEVLQTVPENGKLIIEIKSDHSLLQKLQQELKNSALKPAQIEIIAFDNHILGKAKQLMPEYTMLWLLDLDYYWPWWLLRINEKRIINETKELNLDGVNVWAGKILNREFIQKFKDAGLLVYTWTVNDPDHAKKLIDAGIDGITTDRAAWIKDQISKL